MDVVPPPKCKTLLKRQFRENGARRRGRSRSFDRSQLSPFIGPLNFTSCDVHKSLFPLPSRMFRHTVSQLRNERGPFKDVSGPSIKEYVKTEHRLYNDMLNISVDMDIFTTRITSLDISAFKIIII
ncbi:hypothetical protein GWI33_018250 [Rhynchophorus ferrugineus]|uniref:Uncharacterized protein n=1 Tax=Rhynchophorus ferrugineus TaxID=354439 RepID=A0A834HXL2_RHYFE|nr:hypothetical protein GWI33_018250 [Rhynchophorus ferrugineus]